MKHIHIVCSCGAGINLTDLKDRKVNPLDGKVCEDGTMPLVCYLAAKWLDSHVTKCKHVPTLVSHDKEKKRKSTLHDKISTFDLTHVQLHTVKT